MISRRVVFAIITASLAVASAGMFARSSLSRIPKTVCVPAKDMKDRAVAFRQDFVSRYLEKNADYPIFEIMLSSNMRPIDNRDADKLGQRGVLKISNVAGQPTSRLLSNSTGSAMEPRFPVLINDQAIPVRFRIPKPLNIRATFQPSSLFFEFPTKMLITLEDDITSGGVPLGISKDQTLKSVLLSDDALIYKFEDGAGTPLTIKLDLTGTGCP